MATVYDLKPKFQGLLRPLLSPLRRMGFTPNGLTVLSLVLSLGVGFTLALEGGERPAVLFILPLWLFLRMALNALDGMMAREMAMTTPLGGLLNEAGDVLSDGALYLPFAWISPSSAPAVVAFAFFSALTEVCGIAAHAQGASRRYDGPMGKSDRAFIVGALALATALYPPAGRFWPAFFWSATLLAGVTCCIRVKRALAEMPSFKEKEEGK